MIVPYAPHHRRHLIEICYRTGMYGQDLTGTDKFHDKEGFALRFVLHYPEFAPDLAFVAEHEGKPVGYIVGTTDTLAQKADFAKNWAPRIRRHLWTNTFWIDLGDYRRLKSWIAAGKSSKLTAAFLADYPAHLHINLLPEAQGLGLGTQLMERFLGELRQRGVSGVHLGTNSANHKAVPFYRKLGFTVLEQTPSDMWNLGGDLQSLMFGLKLTAEPEPRSTPPT